MKAGEKMAEHEKEVTETMETRQVGIMDIDDFIFGGEDPGPSQR